MRQNYFKEIISRQILIRHTDQLEYAIECQIESWNL